jgi:phage repressor protein C with HTH and peptisase S24 domain
MLHHADIWRAIDLLAARHGLSASGLARKAGLNPTSFNPSKRIHGRRKRWPSTESISCILQATATDLDEFVALAEAKLPARSTLPLLDLKEAEKTNLFDEKGNPKDTGSAWESMPMKASTDPNAFVLEISGKALEPVYRDRDRIVVAPSDSPRRGDRIVLQKKTGEILICQLGRETTAKVEMIGFNPQLPTVSLPRTEIAWYHRILWASQ